MEQENRLKTGTTTVGLKCKDGVIVASESKATMGNLISSKEAKKVHQIDDRIALTIAGGVGDAQQLIRVIKAEINIYKVSRNTEITVNAVTTLLSNILQSSRYYPIMAMLLVGGYDKDGAHLYSIDPVGGAGDDDYNSTGSGSPFALGVLEHKYKPDLPKDEAIKLAVDSIKAAKERDAFSGGKWIQVAFINENGVEFIDKQTVNNLLK